MHKSSIDSTLKVIKNFAFKYFDKAKPMPWRWKTVTCKKTTESVDTMYLLLRLVMSDTLVFLENLAEIGAGTARRHP